MKDNVLHEFKLALKHLESICDMVGHGHGKAERYCNNCIYDKDFEKNKICPCTIASSLRKVMQYYENYK